MKRITVLLLLVVIVLTGCGGSASDTEKQPASNIKKLEFFSNNDDINLEVGEKYSSGYLKVDVKDKKSFTPNDVVFISDNPEIATIAFTHDALTNHLYYEVVAVGGGETEVYARSKNGLVESKHIKVIVPMPIEVESVSIDYLETEFALGDTISFKATVLPKEAKDKAISWSSTDESVATVNDKGEVTTVGGGTTTIKATASNGIEDSIDINVDALKRVMKLTVTHSRKDDINIGNEWSYVNEVNGEQSPRTIVVSVGDILKLHSQYSESDDNPDVGEASATHKVTEEDFNNGFEVTMDLYVKENGGKNSGKSAHFLVTYKFSL